jgi:hypothetical protein
MMPTAAKESEIAEGAWVDPAAGRVAVTEYVEAWVTDHPRLRVRSRENYGAYLRNQIAPGLGSVTLSDLSPAGVRRWLRELADAGSAKARRAGAYGLLRAALNTPVADRVLVRNPCNLPGAGTVRTRNGR